MKLSDEAESAYRRQDYSARPPIEGVQLVELRRASEDAGSMTELARLSEGKIADPAGFSVAQVNYATLEPGAIKAFHVHRNQTDVWFVPPEDRILVVLVDVRKGSPSEGRRQRFVLGDTRAQLLRIPPGVAHGCRNLASSAGRILYFTDRNFSSDPGRTDEGRLPWSFLGEDVWETRRE